MKLVLVLFLVGSFVFSASQIKTRLVTISEGSLFHFTVLDQWAHVLTPLITCDQKRKSSMIE
ncbi:hypothetical protein GLYMA_04G076950v4 [Glycine max]|nr:hypothetical protein GLYMA_04G076950v4 [Glycine max]KAH1110317.1 hypothetical protein GYH30_009261 [Glycine max]